MFRSSLPAALTLAIFTLTSGGLNAQEQRQPKYKGKTAAQWIALLPDEKLGTDALTALTELGPDAQKAALPVAVEMLEDRSKEYRYFAADCLGAFAKQASPQVAVRLAALLKDENGYVRYKAIRNLSKFQLGAEFLPPLTSALADDDARVRIGTCELLGRLGAQAKPAVPSLIRLLKANLKFVPQDMYWEDKLFAASAALGQIGEPASEAIPHMQHAIRNPPDYAKCFQKDYADKCANEFQAKVLADLGKVGSNGLAAQLEFWDYKKGLHRPTILATLGSLKAKGKQYIPLIEGVLKDGDRDCKREAAIALWRIDRRNSVVPTLLDMLEFHPAPEPPNAAPAPIAGGGEKPKVEIDNKILRFLPELGAQARGALPAVEKLYRDAKEDDRPALLDIIRAIDPAAADAIKMEGR